MKGLSKTIDGPWRGLIRLERCPGGKALEEIGLRLRRKEDDRKLQKKKQRKSPAVMLL